MPANVRESSEERVVSKLSLNDIPLSIALSESAGFKDSVTDWQILHESALVLGVQHGSGLLAQGAFADFGEVGVLSKIVVAPSMQRQGLGGKIIDGLISAAESKAVGCLGVVATAVGRTLLERHGFVPAGDIVILMGTPHVPLGHGHAPALDDVDAAVALDKRMLGATRERMLRAREKRAIATVGHSDKSGALCGYAMATELGTHAMIGPVVADGDESAQSLVIGVCQEWGEAVRIDVPAEQSAFRQWLRSIGLREQGTRVEMVRGSRPLPFRKPARYAVATQAFG
jgi:GNAT superfamily N-acetyltransferase